MTLLGAAVTFVLTVVACVGFAAVILAVDNYFYRRRKRQLAEEFKRQHEQRRKHAMCSVPSSVQAWFAELTAPEPRLTREVDVKRRRKWRN